VDEFLSRTAAACIGLTGMIIAGIFMIFMTIMLGTSNQGVLGSAGLLTAALLFIFWWFLTVLCGIPF
jgi:hypothetical protein